VYFYLERAVYNYDIMIYSFLSTFELKVHVSHDPTLDYSKLDAVT